jgi:hypothetical protein
MRTPVDCPDVVIAQGATDSNTVRASIIHADATAILLGFLSGDAAPTYTIQINSKEDGSGTWTTLNDGTADIKAPASTKSSTYPYLNFTFRIHASVATGSLTTFFMKKAYAFMGG